MLRARATRPRSGEQAILFPQAMAGARPKASALTRERLANSAYIPHVMHNEI